VPGAFEIFDGGSNKFFRAFLKLGQAVFTAKEVVVPFIRGSDFAIGGNARPTNRVQEEERRQVFLGVFLEFSQTLDAAEGVIQPFIGGSKQAFRGYHCATDGIFLD
jgi:hypothetical protein